MREDNEFRVVDLEEKIEYIFHQAKNSYNGEKERLTRRLKELTTEYRCITGRYYTFEGGSKKYD